mgnify:CR=1 FL=1
MFNATSNISEQDVDAPGEAPIKLARFFLDEYKTSVPNSKLTPFDVFLIICTLCPADSVCQSLELAIGQNFFN